MLDGIVLILFTSAGQIKSIVFCRCRKCTRLFTLHDRTFQKKKTFTCSGELGPGKFTSQMYEKPGRVVAFWSPVRRHRYSFNWVTMVTSAHARVYCPYVLFMCIAFRVFFGQAYLMYYLFSGHQQVCLQIIA